MDYHCRTHGYGWGDMGGHGKFAPTGGNDLWDIRDLAGLTFKNEDFFNFNCSALGHLLHDKRLNSRHYSLRVYSFIDFIRNHKIRHAFKISKKICSEFVTTQVFRLKTEVNQVPLKDPKFCLCDPRIVFSYSL